MVTTPDRREGHDLRTFSPMGTQSWRMAWRASVLLRLFTLVVCFTLSAGDYPRNQGEQGTLGTYCQWETFNATCGPNEVVMMKSARFGRMKLNRCLESDFSIGCGSDVLLEADRRCSGRHHCTISIPDPTLHNQQSCPKDMGAYLEASYTCLEVAGTDKSPCGTELKGPSGYLANVITEKSSRGSNSCPWTIRVQKGQKINITLYDFTGATQVFPSGGEDLGVMEAGGPAGDRYCTVYASIKESSKERRTTLCGGRLREKPVYTSSSNTLDIEITGVSTPGQQLYFILKYEAIGCPDLKLPTNAWATRDWDKAEVRCNFTSQTWHLVCKGTTWIGDMTNCTGTSWATGQRGGRGLLPPYGLLVAVIIGVILGVVLGLCLLGIVLGCKRKRAWQKSRSALAGRQSTPRTEFYDAYDRATYKEQTCTLRRGEPGYTHVWELRSQKPPQEMECAAVQKLSAYHERALHARNACPGLQQQPRGEHIYESPKFERRTLGRDPRSGEPVRRDFQFCTTFDPHAENARNMTLRNNKNDDLEQTSDDTEDEIECDIHFPKKIGYRPVPRHQSRDGMP